MDSFHSPCTSDPLSRMKYPSPSAKLLRKLP